MKVYRSSPPYNISAGVTIVGLLLLIPYFFGIHANTFEYRDFGVLLRILTCLYILFNMFFLGMRTLLNIMKPLSTPCIPVFFPQSPNMIPANGSIVFEFLRGTTKKWGP